MVATPHAMATTDHAVEFSFTPVAAAVLDGATLAQFPRDGLVKFSECSYRFHDYLRPEMRCCRISIQEA